MTTQPDARPARLFYDRDADLGRLASRRIAVLGFGSQGHAHALNLRDSGLEVVVGLRPESNGVTAARRAGLPVMPVAEAVAGAGVVMVLVPDPVHRTLFEAEIGPNLTPGATLLFAHGFSVRFGQVSLPDDVDVGLVAPMPLA